MIVTAGMKERKMLDDCITAGTETLFRQAPMTAHDYMLNAISDIDKRLGKGYAKQHPEADRGLHTDGGQSWALGMVMAERRMNSAAQP